MFCDHQTSTIHLIPAILVQAVNRSNQKYKPKTPYSHHSHLRSWTLPVTWPIIERVDTHIPIFRVPRRRARLDAFHHQCLRKILRIPPSFISRVENSFVLERSGLPLMFEQMLTRQRQVFVKIRDHGNDLIKHLLFTDSGQPKIWNARRKRGRPRQRWITEVSRHVI